MRFLVSLLLFAALSVRAQYSSPYYYTINADDTVAITGYLGSGGVVTIPDTIEGYTVTDIGGSVFALQEDVTSVTIPTTVTNIIDGAFDGSTNITAINVAANNPSYVSVDGVLYNTPQTDLIAFPEGSSATSYMIPDSVVVIGVGAFAGCASLVSVTLPSGITDIANGEFSDSFHLADVIIPDGVTNIEDNAFRSTAVTNLTVPGSVVSLGDYAFSKCLSLTNITIGDGVTSIGNSTFWESGLDSITVPDSVTNIENYAFWYSGNLQSAVIGGGVREIGVQVFSYCPSLAEIDVNSSNSAYMSAGGVLFDKSQRALIQYPTGNAATSYSLPGSVVNIGEWSFLACDNLASVSIDNNATNIGAQAFELCASLKNVTIPNSVIGVGEEAFSTCASLVSAVIGNNVNSIQYATFADCSNLTSVVIGNSVTAIGNLAFYFTGLTGISIPDSVTSIGQAAFDSTSLTNLMIPDSVGDIAYQAFADCTNLATLAIGNGLTNLDEQAFIGCSSLTSAIIGSGITNLGYEAFAYCPELSAVYFEGNAPAADTSVFLEDPVTVYYRPGTTGWPAFATATGVTVTPWLPQITIGPGFGMQSNQFGFDISAPPNTAVTVQACTNLAHPVWTNLNTVTITNGTLHFSEPAQFNVASRFYRLSWQ